jgi:hypothetical protein
VVLILPAVSPKFANTLFAPSIWGINIKKTPKTDCMKKKFSLLLFCFISCSLLLQAQQTEVKRYAGVKGGEVDMLYNWGELQNGNSDKVFLVSVRTAGSYYLKALASRRYKDPVLLYVNGVKTDYIYPETEGWQWLAAALKPVPLIAGKNEIRFKGFDAAVPMIEELSLTNKSPWTSKAMTPGDRFIETMQQLKQQPAATFKPASEVGDLTNKVLPNPAGNYDHAIDTQFSYSHFSWIYLAAGYHNFETSGSTINRTLAVFNPSNFIYSWGNVNSGPGGESGLYLYVALAGYYAVTLRPVTDGQTGTTNIIYNGTTLVSNAAIGGRRIAMSVLKGGNMNFFTCKLTGSTADTRMQASRYPMSSARGYNDDYGGTGAWVWGRASRIKKDFSGTDSVQYGFVCAYTPISTGVCDIYLGTGNSNLHDLEPQNFPLLSNDDAILTAPSSGTYNCIAWSGGITTSWVWPPYSLSTYSCTSANYLQCFDNFYSNNPVRYPGAWNYTRTGATVSNSMIDLWKTATAYTHASVRKPGNNNPHGYDWESKPGSLCRTLHPRTALNQANWYGFANDYYIPTGTYARIAGAAQNYATDADAIKAGVAVLDVATLTRGAQDKLGKLMQQLNPAFVRRFNELYAAWNKTKAANASQSDPSAYCKNKEHEALAALGKSNAFASLILVMDKFTNGNDHLLGDLLVALAKEKYGRLLEEVKAERLSKPNDEQGRYKIHGDHDNGVLYVEKILKLLDINTEIKPLAEAVLITVSPNPVSDRFTVTVKLTQSSRVTVQATSAQTRITKMVQKQINLPAGEHPFAVVTAGLTGAAGDIITVQVTVDGVVKTVKALVAK